MSVRPENAAADHGKDGAEGSARLARAGEDWDQLMVVLTAAFAGMAGRIDPPSSLTRMTAADLAETAARHEVWVIGAPAIATITLSQRKDCLYLGKLAVLPAYQGRGLAKQLITLAGQRAQALGLPELMLQTRVELVENHAFFRHAGFVETARRAHAGYARPTTVEFRKAVLAGAQV